MDGPKYIIIGLVSFLSASGFCQKPKDTYNTKIYNPRNVNVRNYIDTQLVIINQNLPIDKSIYLLYVDGYTDSLSSPANNRINVNEFTFGSPDSIPLNNINIEIVFSKPFDSAYLDNKVEFKKTSIGFTNVEKGIRNSRISISPDKTTLVFKAGFIKAGTLIKLVFTHKHSGGLKFTIKGAEKLY